MGIQKGLSPNTGTHRRHLTDAKEYILPAITRTATRKVRALPIRKR